MIIQLPTMRTLTNSDIADCPAVDHSSENLSYERADLPDFDPGNGETGSSSVHAIDPLTDPRWETFLERNPNSSIFHTRAWLEALRRTYGYTPVVYTTTPQGSDLRNGILFCDVKSWLTGNRLVSLPFSDHCEPLIEQPEELRQVYFVLDRLVRSQLWRYVELRPITTMEPSASLNHLTVKYHFHQLDLTRNLGTIFQNFHKNCIQRKIKRAEREALEYREDSNLRLLDDFYRLFCTTRQRHKVPPAPLSWFLNLIEAFGNQLKIRMAFKDDRPIAGMLTIRHKHTTVYKYGCSDIHFKNLGGMHLLYWKSIQEAKNTGSRVFDFGRCDFDQKGLMVFKRRWGATESTLTYSRFAIGDNGALHFPPNADSLKMRFAKELFAHLPVKCLSFLGSVLYRHVG